MGTTSAPDQTVVAPVDRFVDEVLDGGDLAVLEEVVVDDIVQHGPGTDTKVFGTARLAEFVADIRESFPNLSVKRNTVVVGEDVVVETLTFTGTHAGQFMGVPPTGTTVIISGMAGFRVENGKIAETWLCMDRMGALQQMQALSTPELTTDQREFPTEDLPFDWESRA